MRLSAFYFVLVATLFFYGCPPPEDCTEPLDSGKPAHTLIFFDNTLSSAIPTKLQQEYTDTLRDIIHERYQSNTATLYGYYIHERTLDARPFQQDRFKLEEPDRTNLPPLKCRLAKQSYEKDKTNLQNQSAEKLIEAFNAINTSSTAQWTDIWATLEIINRHFSALDKESPRQIIFLSDMVESMRGDSRKDYHRKPLADKAAAEAAAKEDLAWIRENLRVGPDCMKGIQVKILPPAPSIEGQKNLRNIRYYWEALFKELGCTEISFY